MVDLPEIDDELPPKPESVEDLKNTAVKMAFLGAGQGGGNLAEAFWQLGYRRVAVVNTTSRDMQRLTIPETNRHLFKSPGGAGKDPSVGKKCIEAEYEDVFRLCQNSFKKDVDQILICAGMGGGTGTGSVRTLINLAREYLTSIGVKDAATKVGVIATLPTRDESAAVQRNALEALEPLLDLAERGELSPLVLVDNARVMALYGQASVVDVWTKANKNIAALFDVFNVLCAADDDSVHVTCDPQDYRTVLLSGILTFGRTKIGEVKKPSDLADAVRENVKKGLLVEGLDISRATHGAAILLADAESLNTISQEALENAFGSLNRLMHQGPETKLHRGVYASAKPGIYLYSILGNLGRPAQRLAEMKAKAGL